MLNYKKIIITYVLVCLGCNVQASVESVPQSPKITGIEHALVSAYQNNQELLEKRQEVLAKHESIVQALASFRPSVNLSGEVNRSVTAKSGDQKNLGATASGADEVNRKGTITLTQNIFAGGSSVAQYKGTDYSIKSAWSSLLASEQGVLFQAAQAFLELASKQSEVEVHKANVEAMRHNYESALAKMKTGEETLTQVSLAEGKWAEASSRLASATAEVNAARATYERITGVAAPFRCNKPGHITNVPKSFEDMLNCALEINPHLIAAQFDLKAAKQEKKKYTGAMLPKVDLTARSFRSEGHSSGTSILTPKVSQSKDYTTNNEVGVSVMVPLYDGGSLRSQRRQASEVAIGKRITIERVKQQIIEQAKQAWQNYQTAKENVGLTHKQVKAQVDALNGTKREMEVGSKILLDVLNAQSALLEAELRLINAEKVMLLESYKILLAMGLLSVQYLKLPVEPFDPIANYQKVKKRF